MVPERRLPVLGEAGADLVDEGAALHPQRSGLPEELGAQLVPHCARWFEVAAEATRAHRKFCSDSCRIMAYRDRQDAARRLHAGGKSFEEVARGLGSTAATVERWVTGVKEERQPGDAS
jgi:predicted nucleic acid-binding Zn ribbon protein